MLLSIQDEIRCHADRHPNGRAHQLRLTPLHEAHQKVIHWHVEAPGRVRVHRDAHGNLTHTLTLAAAPALPIVRIEGMVETSDEPTILPEGYLPAAIYRGITPLTEAGDELARFARDCLDDEPDPVYGLFDLMAAVRDQVNVLSCLPYDGSTAQAAFALGAGSVEDLTHVFIAACRSLGIPARYVSGYRYARGEERMLGHAWAETWVTDLGWIGFDILHNRTANGELCKLAVGRDYSEARPLRC